MPAAAGEAKAPPVGWRTAPDPVGYEAAVVAMETHVAGMLAGSACELAWLVEHPPLYTAGTSARPDELLSPGRLPVHGSGRGGRYTYHGPGQRVVYVMLDLRRRGGDVRSLVTGLERWLIRALAELGVTAFCRQGRIGVWVPRPDKGAGLEDKIAAIGIRIRRQVTYHGIALNVAPDLSAYDGIVPCGITGHGVTSLAELGRSASMAAVDSALRRAFEAEFGPTNESPP